MASGRRALAVVAVLLVTGSGLVGCARVPDDGPPVPVPNRKLEQGANPPVNSDLAGPGRTSGPVDTITLLTLSARTTQNRDLIGETFLTTSAREAWKRAAADVLIYRPTGPLVLVSQKATTATVRFTGLHVATVNDAGVYQAVSPRPLVINFNLVRGEVWLLNTAPPGVLLPESDVNQAFQQVTLYFPKLDEGPAADAASSDVLVPEVRHLDRAASRTSIVTPIVRLLLRGASQWLEPVTRDPLPKNTGLRGNVTIQGSDLIVDLSPEVESASASSLNTFAAQVGWSLQGRLEGSLRLQVNGRPLNVKGVPAVQNVRNWTRYNPSAGTAASVYCISKGALFELPDRPGAAPTPPEKLGGAATRNGVLSAAITANDNGVAVVKAAGGRQTLWMGEMTGELRAGPSATTISRPTWGNSTTSVLAALDGVLYQVETDGTKVAVAVQPPGAVGRIRAVRLAPDGARIALVAGDGAAAKAYVGLIQHPPDGSAPVLRDIRPVRGPLAQDITLLPKVQDIGWSGPTKIAVAGLDAAGDFVVRQLSIDGALEADVPLKSDSPQGDVMLAATPLIDSPQVPYVAAGGQLYAAGPRSWSLPLAEPRSAQAPFYPG